MERNNQYLNSLISQMSLDEKIGAILTLGFAGTVPRRHIYDFIEKYYCGGLRLSCDTRVFGSYVDPKSSKTVVSVENEVGCKYKSAAPVCTASEYKEILDGLQAAARKRHLSIPLHFSFDEDCLQYGGKVAYLETDYSYDEKDKAQIEKVAEKYDTIVFTSYFTRSKLGNLSWLEPWVKAHKDKKIVIVSNTPYEELSIPASAENVIVTFATSPENVKVTAGVLFGEIVPEGVWPLKKPL